MRLMHARLARGTQIPAATGPACIVLGASTAVDGGICRWISSDAGSRHRHAI